MAPPRIEQKEIETYWNIFSARTNGGTVLTGEQAAPVLKNSGLRDDQLERVWDLADVDNDGNLDFEEFCVAMRLIFDILNGEYPDVPNTLPDWLVPESKAHLVQAGRALTGKAAPFTPVAAVDDDPDSPSLKDGFDWYMSPADKAKYEQIYMENRDMRGEVAWPVSSLQDLYDSLDVPDTDIRSAWNLINPAAAPSIHKDACLAFLHILNYRHEGYRIPRTVPASLRASFERNKIDYQVGNASSAAAAGHPSSRWAVGADESTSTGRKAKFGDQYLTRLGRSNFKAAGTDFSSAQSTEDWEEVRLRKQLQDLDGRIRDIEANAAARRSAGGGGGGGTGKTKPALVKRELEQLLDYKRKALRDLEDSDTNKAGAGGAGSLKSVSDDLQTVREQVESLEAHLRQREHVLAQLRRDIDDEAAAAR
ncbi:cytoskeletal adaptor protein [Niveomyces insectorum RCEF 264]|uniref:Endocytosis protein 3 n=1 Tax=Niveomyces insectorum RCEF 264 TaxID=1081102 RepID=A0A167QYH7_9HYPO|nr:cytoskeletal adaptor protein [Niveomyces insectorum RCEF 264]